MKDLCVEMTEILFHSVLPLLL